MAGDDHARELGEQLAVGEPLLHGHGPHGGLVRGADVGTLAAGEAAERRVAVEEPGAGSDRALGDGWRPRWRPLRGPLVEFLERVDEPERVPPAMARREQQRERGERGREARERRMIMGCRRAGRRSRW